jgi:hypothetical protein
VWAEALPPRCTILSPPDGACVEPGGNVCFQGQALGGISPLTLTWEDATDGILGTGPSVCATLSTPAPGHSVEDSVHTVQLTVRDALGREGHARVEICLRSLVSVPEDALEAVPRIGSVFPNPAAGTVRISFSVRAGESYRIDVFNTAGRRIARLVDGGTGDGRSASIDWDGRGVDGRRVPSGVYFARLTAGSRSTTRQFVLMR